MKFRAAQANGKPIQGVSNMIQDLVYVVDKEPDFAEAHNMLALARLQGGGVHSAAESITVAIELSPRNEEYLLNLAQIDLAGKKVGRCDALARPASGQLKSGKSRRSRARVWPTCPR